MGPAIIALLFSLLSFIAFPLSLFTTLISGTFTNFVDKEGKGIANAALIINIIIISIWMIGLGIMINEASKPSFLNEVLNPTVSIIIFAVIIGTSLLINLRGVYKINKSQEAIKKSGKRYKRRNRMNDVPEIELFNDEPTNIIDTSQWSIELLKALEWKRFEDVCTEYFTLAGYEAKQTDLGADGGVDAVLYKKDKPFALVQCKARTKGKVGVKTARELLGVMTVQSVKNGILITNSGFTDDAIAFDKEIKAKKSAAFNLVDCKWLLRLIKKLPENKQKALLAVATYQDFQTPTCPRCGGKMTKRHRKKDNVPFWGCMNFPKCRQIINIANQ